MVRNELRRLYRRDRRWHNFTRGFVPVLLLTLGGTSLLALVDSPPPVSAAVTQPVAAPELPDQVLNTTAHPFTRPPVSDIEMEGQRTTRYVESPLGNYWVTTWEDEGRFRFKYDDGTYSDWVDMDEGLKVVEDEIEGYYTQWA